MIDFETVGTVISFKLISGDEIIGLVEDEGDVNWTINQPVAIAPAREGGIMLVPYMMSVDPAHKFPLNKKLVVMYRPTADQVADHYREITTGIKTVRKPGIVLG